MRYRLRTLLILAAVVPPIVAPISVWWWREYVAWRNSRAVSASDPMYLGAVLDYVPGEAGIHVAHVNPGSPAESCGLLDGDFIYSVEKRPCDIEQLVGIISQSNVGRKLHLSIRRDGERKVLVVVLARKPTSPP